MARIEVSSENGVRRIRIASPPLNLLDGATMESLAEALLEPGAHQKAIVIAGGPPHFSAGADVGEHLPDRGGEAMLATLERLFGALDAAPAVTVALVRGACLGAGFELALACDLVYASSAARLGLPEIKLGVFPPIACALLERRIPGPVARDLILTGRQIDGETAGRLGIASRVFPEESFDALAASAIGELAASSGAALRAAKRALRAADGPSARSRIAWANSVYREETLHAPEAIEGLTAFLEKRTPTWRTVPETQASNR